MSVLDKQAEHYGFDYSRTAAENKEIFLEMYSIEYALPSFSVMDACFYNKDPRYVFQLINVTYPPDETYVHEGRHHHMMKYSDIYGKHRSKAVIRLMELDEEQNFKACGDEVDLGT